MVSLMTESGIHHWQYVILLPAGWPQNRSQSPIERCSCLQLASKPITNLLISDSIRRMSNTAPPPGFPSGSTPQMPWPPAKPTSGTARWPIVVMFAITLVAAAVAAWLRPKSEAKSAAPSAPTFTEKQVSDVKATTCAAYEKVRRAMVANASQTGGDDPTAQLAVAVNARQAYVASSAHLLTVLANQPATPADLATAARKLADLF
jgi:hypothetical protein